MEQSLKISLVGDYSDYLIDGLIDALKKEFNQESVLLTISSLDIEYR